MYDVLNACCLHKLFLALIFHLYLGPISKEGCRCFASFMLSHACQFSIRSQLTRVWPHVDSLHSRSQRSSATRPVKYAVSHAECVLSPLISAASAAGPTSLNCDRSLDVAKSRVSAELGLLLSASKICTHRGRYALQPSERSEWYSAVLQLAVSRWQGACIVAHISPVDVPKR